MITGSFFAEGIHASTKRRTRIAKVVGSIVVPFVVLLLLFFLDYPLRALVRNQQSPFLNHFFDVIKYGGNVVVGFSLALVMIGVGKFACKNKLSRVGNLMLLSLIFSNLIVLIAKPVLDIHPRNDFRLTQRHHPQGERWGRFPSGDATVAFSISASLAAEFPPLIIPCYALGCLVGVERVYFNLHFFSDVFAGGWLAIAVVDFLRRKYFFTHPANSSHNATRDNHS
jgi:membrane-associated phospholipid phosphatase